MKDGCVKARKIDKSQPKKVKFQPAGKVAKYPRIEKEHVYSVFKKLDA